MPSGIPRKFADLPPKQKALITQIRNAYRELGPDEFIDEADAMDEAVRRNFPGWKSCFLFPFIIPNGDWGIVDHTGSQIGNLYTLDATRAWNLPGSPGAPSPESFLVSLGLFILGSDPSGARFCIDTHSKTGLEVVMVDYYAVMERLPSILKDELTVWPYVWRFKQPLVEFLKAVYTGDQAFRVHF